MSRKRKAKSKPAEREVSAPTPGPQIARASLLTVLRITGFFFLGLSVLAMFSPASRLWAFHYLAFLPPIAAILILLGGGLLLTPICGRVTFWLTSRTRFLRGRSAWIWALLTFAVLWGLRVEVPLLGDGQLWIRELTWIGEFTNQGSEIPLGRTLLRKEPLSLGVHEYAFRAVAHLREPDPPATNPPQAEAQKEKRLNWFRDAARETYSWMSIFAGALLVFLLIRFARRRLSEDSRTPFLLTIFAGGGVLLFFGYVENYTWTSFWVIACLLSGIEESMPPRRLPLRTLAAFAIAVGFHYSALILLPAVIHLLMNLHFQPADDKKSRTRMPLVRERYLTLAFFVAAIAGYIRVEGWKGWISIIPLMPRWSKDGYSFVSFAHGIDIVNLLVLVGLAAMVLRFLLKPAQNASHFDLTREGFLNLASGCGLLFVFVFNPNLGMARDWDLLAVAIWPMVITAAWKLSQYEFGSARAGLIAALLGMIVLIPLPSVLVNTMYAPSVNRFKSLLEIDQPRSAYGWENLALHYQRRGEIENRVDAWRHAMNVERNPRYVFNYADALKLAGRIEEADPYYLEAALAMRDSKILTYREQLRNLAMRLLALKNFERAKVAIDTYCELMPEDTLYGPRIQMMIEDATVVNDLMKAREYEAARIYALEARGRDPQNSYWVKILQEIRGQAVNP